MTKAMALKVVNPLLAVVFLVQAVTGVCHGLMPYEVFALLHKPAGALLVILIIVHLYLNWNWIKTTFFKGRRR